MKKASKKVPGVLPSRLGHSDARSTRIIRTLEGIVRDCKAGRGDVLNRFANHHLPDEGVDSLGQMLAGILFGDRAIRRCKQRGGSIIVGPRDHRSFHVIGDGSVERGVAVVIASARGWARKDAPGMAQWFLASRSILERNAVDLYLDASSGFVVTKAWNIPVRSSGWYDLVGEVVKVAAESIDDLGFRDTVMPDDVVRTMAMMWNLRGFSGRRQAVAA